ncbi:hypothetical protein [Leptolyngbya ohadii]|uniref:hypothetical protein n=1 Tax=Leptolyngbya ohadii TaxID=1962290 RepID=UPI00117B5F2A|nr:hypothetical protein [Leptolyngbya ohadii]
MVMLLSLGRVSLAQTEVRSGVLPLFRLMDWSAQSDLNLSAGTLAELQTDPNFDGDFQLIFNAAANILSGYRVVARGGYFPENAGIPRNQQLTTAQGVYRLYTLDNGDFLMLYRSPNENTSRYFIRRAGAGFLLP